MNGRDSGRGVRRARRAAPLACWILSAAASGCSVTPVADYDAPPPAQRFAGTLADGRPIALVLEPRARGIELAGTLGGIPVAFVETGPPRAQGELVIGGGTKPAAVELSASGVLVLDIGGERAELTPAPGPPLVTGGPFEGEFHSEAPLHPLVGMRLRQHGQVVTGEASLFGATWTVVASEHAGQGISGTLAADDGSKLAFHARLQPAGELRVSGIGPDLILVP